MLILGKRVDAAAGTDATFRIPPETLLRHAVFLGASGSGKTVASKVLVEEALRSGIPAIVVDPQGDLASLALPGDPVELARKGLDDSIAREVLARSEVVVWTPGSDAGIPLGLSPLSLANLPEDKDARADALGIAARATAGLVGYNLEKEDGKTAEAAILLCLEDALARGAEPGGFEGLARLLSDPGTALATRLAGVSDEAARETLAKRLRRALVGSTGRIFDRGVPLDIDVLLGRDERLLGSPGAREAYPRTRCSVIYLNSLSSPEEKEFFLAELTRALLRWMLQHPSEKPQALFFVDEVAPFLPPVRKPACRDALRLLAKQARKYGIACVFATQNPGDVDYKSLAQCSTWGLGRMTLKQDLKKLEAFIKGVASEHVEVVQSMLPGRPVGELLYLAPDVEKGVVPVKTRWLATQHRTLDLDEVRKLTTPEQRRRFEALAQKMRARIPAPAPIASAPPAPTLDKPSGPKKPVPLYKPPAAAAPTPAPAPPEPDETDEPAAPPSDVDALGPRLLDVLNREMAALTADELQELVKDVPPTRFKRVLKALTDSGAVRRERCGRSFVHWHPRHAFDIENKKLRPAFTAEAKILEGDALARAKSQARSKFLILDAETVEGLRLRHLPLHRVRVRAKRQKGFFVKEEFQVESTLYLHPVDARVLELSSGNELRFVPAPREKAEDVQDLDQVVRDFAKVPPGTLSVRSDLEASLSHAQVEAALKRKFAVDEILGIDVVHVPYWEFTLRDSEKKTERRGAVDALVGSPFNPEAVSEG